MLATLSKDHPPGAGWVFERKLDGVRMIATRERGQSPRLWSRNQKSMDASYPEIVEALDDARARRGSCSTGRSPPPTARSPACRRACTSGPEPGAAHRGGGGGAPVRPAGARRRRRHARCRSRRGTGSCDAVVDVEAPLFRSPALEGDPSDLLTEACAGGWEGLIAKRADAPYVRRRAQPRLAQAQVRARPGVRHRRLDRSVGLAARAGGAAGRVPRPPGWTGCGTRARSAPATTPRR